MSVEHWRNGSDGENEVLGENPVPGPLCPPQITQGLDPDTAVSGQRLSEPWYLTYGAEVHLIYIKNLGSTAQKISILCFRYIDQVVTTIQGEKINVFCHNETKRINILCGQNAAL